MSVIALPLLLVLEQSNDSANLECTHSILCFEENAKARKEKQQDRKMNETVISATDQFQRQVDKRSESKLEVLLAI